MMFARIAVLTTAVFLAAACESHSSVAPVVYGTDPGYKARVYHNPHGQQMVAQQAVYTPAPQASPSASIEPVQLTPISAVYLSDPAPQQQKLVQPAPSSPLLIEVKPGDTVYAIGRAHDVSPKAIIAANNLQPPYTLSVGQTLRLPEEARQTASAKAEPAPVRKVVARDTVYLVHQGDTLYSISQKSGVPLKTIAQANGIATPYIISPGQRLLIPQAPVDSQLYAEAKPKAKAVEPTKASAKPKDLPPKADVADIAKTVSYDTKPISPDAMFDWPVKGKVIASYGAADRGRRNDGVNIAAPTGSPVRAAADGEVVYRGSELDGFGNLLLVKHTDGYVTAYAHNDAMLVKKGDKVRQGQVIAKVGQTGAVSSPQLHFEIRQNLKSVDPVALLGTD